MRRAAQKFLQPPGVGPDQVIPDQGNVDRDARIRSPARGADRPRLPPWVPYLETFSLGWESATYNQKPMSNIKSRPEPKWMLNADAV
jgi:hypothetical protein